MKIAYAGPDEAARLAALHASAFDTPWSDADLLELMRGVGVTALAAEEGFILLRVLGPEAEVLTLAVAPEARRRGLGRRLVESALGAAAAGGAEAVFLEVAADNAPALRVYAAAGFKPAGLRRGYYRRTDEPAMDAVLLRRALNSPAG